MKLCKLCFSTTVFCSQSTFDVLTCTPNGWLDPSIHLFSKPNPFIRGGREDGAGVSHNWSFPESGTVVQGCVYQTRYSMPKHDLIQTQSCLNVKLKIEPKET